MAARALAFSCVTPYSNGVVKVLFPGKDEPMEVEERYFQCPWKAGKLSRFKWTIGRRGFLILSVQALLNRKN